MKYQCQYDVIMFPYYYCRGHTVRAVCESFQMSKDAGFKVVAHMMPDLPNVDLERDIEQFIVRMFVKYLNLLKYYENNNYTTFVCYLFRNFSKILHFVQMV